MQSLILTGVAGNIYVLFTANDAYMRDFDVLVPSDCCASNTLEENQHALDQISKVLKADIAPSTELDFDALQRRVRRRAKKGDGPGQPASKLQS